MPMCCTNTEFFATCMAIADIHKQQCKKGKREQSPELFDTVASSLAKESISEEVKEKVNRDYSILSKQKKPFHIKPKELALMQLEDDTLSSCREQSMKEKNKSHWLIHKECLHKVRQQRKKSVKSIQLVLPEPLREEIMTAYHDEVLAGHCGYFKTAQKIAQ